MSPAALMALLQGKSKDFIAATTPGGIQAQEAAGQQQFVNASTLPNDSPWEDLAKLGVIKGDRVDDLFTKCTLPAGWKKVATDHSMWSNLVDESGKEIGGIFYKAAFYDQRAFMELNR